MSSQIGDLWCPKGCHLREYGTHQTKEHGCGREPQAPEHLYGLPLARWTDRQKEEHAHVVAR